MKPSKKLCGPEKHFCGTCSEGNRRKARQDIRTDCPSLSDPEWHCRDSEVRSPGANGRKSGCTGFCTDSVRDLCYQQAERELFTIWMVLIDRLKAGHILPGLFHLMPTAPAAVYESRILISPEDSRSVCPFSYCTIKWQSWSTSSAVAFLSPDGDSIVISFPTTRLFARYFST